MKVKQEPNINVLKKVLGFDQTKAITKAKTIDTKISNGKSN